MIAPFKLGRVVSTPAAMAAVDMVDISKALGRHRTGDWGTVCEEDWASNDRATGLENPQRILSAYTTDGTKFWIITEWDRSVTTVLLPEDY